MNKKKVEVKNSIDWKNNLLAKESTSERAKRMDIWDASNTVFVNAPLFGLLLAERGLIRTAALVGAVRGVEILEDGTMDDARDHIEDTFDDISAQARYWTAKSDSGQIVLDVHAYEKSLSGEDAFLFAKAANVLYRSSHELKSVQKAKEKIVLDMQKADKKK